MPKRYHGEGRTRCTLRPYVTNRANPCLEGRAAPRLCMWDCTPFGALRTARGFPRAGELSTAWGNAVFLLEGGLGPSHYWGWACSMLGCTAQLHISPAATSLLAWDRCWVLPAGAVCSGCSHSVLQSILLCANPTAWPCSCSGAAPGAPVSLYEHWGIGGGEGMNQRGMLAAPAPGEAHPWSACIASAPWSTRGQGTVSHWYAAPLPHSITPRYARSPFVPI